MDFLTFEQLKNHMVCICYDMHIDIPFKKAGPFITSVAFARVNIHFFLLLFCIKYASVRKKPHPLFLFSKSIMVKKDC